MNEGGSFFMYPLLIMLLTSVVLIFLILAKKTNPEKYIDILKHLGLFALVWGFLGQMLGLIQAFDVLTLSGSASTEILASGLKVALLSPSFGMLVFLVGRFGLMINSIKSV